MHWKPEYLQLNKLPRSRYWPSRWRVNSSFLVDQFARPVSMVMSTRIVQWYFEICPSPFQESKRRMILKRSPARWLQVELRWLVAWKCFPRFRSRFTNVILMSVRILLLLSQLLSLVPYTRRFLDRRIQSFNTSVTPFSPKTLEKRCVNLRSQSGSSERIHKFLFGYHRGDRCCQISCLKFSTVQLSR